MKHTVPILVLVFLVGCATRSATTLRFYEQTEPGLPVSMAKTVDVPRANLRITVNSAPVLTESDMESAELLQSSGGAAVLVRFDPHGAMKLEEMTTRGRGQYMVAMINDRPVAAIRMGQRLPPGQLLLEGDFTDEEAQKMVDSINKVIRKHRPW